MIKTSTVFLLAVVVLWVGGCQAKAAVPAAKGEAKAVTAKATADAAKPKAIPAFPGAEGFGAITAGGRGGKVIEVTSLEDSGPGTYRAALEAEGPRTVVFKVAGIVHLTNAVNIRSPFITIAGQTAPGDGVCIAGESTLINTNDVVIRYMRFRRGALDYNRRDDALGGQPLRNIIVDHCSTSWGLDENLSIYRHMGAKSGFDVPKKLGTENVTIQWCVSSEALNKNGHAFGGTQGGTDASIHHNLYACNTARNPSIGFGDGVDWRNNVLFNWEHRTVDGGDATSTINVVNNYYKPGPATKESVARRICRPQHLIWASAPGAHPKWYVKGNYVVGFPDVTADNTKGVDYDEAPKGVDPNEYEHLTQKALTNVEWKAAAVRTQSAQEAYKLVLEDVGATLPTRDAVDVRVMEMVKTGKPTFGNGIITTVDDIGGYPEYKGGPADPDSDHDGMPDAWEKKHGLNPSDASDASLDKDGDGYTNVEEYLNGTDPTKFVDYSKAENNVNTLRSAR
jgi:pectate lyase